MGTQNEIDDGLTDEERAALALEEDEEGAGDGENNNEEGGDNDASKDDAGDGDSAAAGDPAQDGDGGKEAAASDQGGAAGAEDDAGEQGGEAGVSESGPILIVQPPADADAKLAEISAQKGELLTKFDDGDITAKEYQTELDKLNKQERDIEFAINEAKLAEKIESQRQANEWKATVDAFIATNQRYNPEKSEAMYKLLDLEVRRVATTDEFKGRTDSAAGREILQKAHENLAAQLGFEAKPKAKQDKQPVKKPELPPNLAKVPAAEQNDTNGGKYAVLDRLATTDPIRYEDELMKLSEAERNAYLAA